MALLSLHRPYSYACNAVVYSHAHNGQQQKEERSGQFSAEENGSNNNNTKHNTSTINEIIEKYL